MWIDDDILKRSEEQVALDVWIPKESVIVLGSSNKAELELHLDGCKNSGVPVLKRYGGGGTVLLYPGCVVVSVGLWVKEPYENQRYFALLNQTVSSTLASYWPCLKGLEQNGISDIVMGDKKVAGTSMFRSRNYLLYQASLIVDLDIELLSKCLKHPTKEPDYREGRGHEDFLVGLSDLDDEITAGKVELLLRKGLGAALVESFDGAGELIDPVESQIVHLKKRAGVET
jgi:lipoate-protein ligase A